MEPSSVRQQATRWSGRQKLVRDAAEDPFAQSSMSIAASHDQIRAFIPNEVKQLSGNRSLWLPPHLARDHNAVAAKVPGDIGKMCFGGFRLTFVDSEDQNFFCPLQERKGV